MPAAFDQRLTQFRAAGEATRLRLLCLLRDAELTVTELTRILGQSQPGISRHLKLLTEAGLVERHQEGAWVFYRGTLDAAFTRIVDGLTGSEIDADRNALEAVRQERAAAAAAYFAEHAAEWDALRRMHLSDAEVEAAMLELAPRDVGHLIDLGTGTGRMLTLFAGRYDSAEGYDTSPEMLSLARVKLDEVGITNATVRRGDIGGLEAAGRGDLVLLHHVLHFMAEPERAVGVAARLLAPDGRIVIADFAPHDHEELRERYAHRRLGFSDEEIGRWAEASELCVLQSRSFPPPAGGALTARLWVLGRADETMPQKRVAHG